MDHPEELTHISLCAGYGGIDLGLKRVIPSLRTIAFSEIEAFAVANLVSKIEAGHLDAAPVWSDLKTFPFSSFHGKVDIISGGFPCQPFSAAGRRQGDEDPRHLWPYIVRGIRESSPRMVFFENVEGIISSKLKSNEWSDPEGTPVLLHVLRELERLGYQATAGVFSASEVGAPHQRKRVFILGSKLSNAQSVRLEGSIKQYKLCETCDENEEFSKSTSYLLKSTLRGQELSDTDNAGYNNSSSCETNSNGKKIFKKRSEFSFSQSSGCNNTRWPARRGQERYSWEPPRVLTMDNAKDQRIQKRESQEAFENKKRWALENGQLGRTDRLCNELHRQTKPPMGRGFDGSTDRLDDGELYESFDNITDELRLLGNGVVPDTAARAFEVLWSRLGNADKHTTGNESKDDIEKINQTDQARKTTILNTTASSGGG